MEQPVKQEVIKAKAEKIEQPKVLGKIKLEEKRSKADKKGKKTAETKSAKGKKKKIAEEEIEAPVAEIREKEIVPPVISEETPVETSDQLQHPEEEIEKDVPYRTEREKLTGPTILGKINLPVDPPKKKPVASSATYQEDKLNKKKKRRRTDKRVNISKQLSTNKPSDPAKPGWSKAKPDFHKKKSQVGPEVTDKQIQDQIKATLARLSGGGKSRSSKMRRMKREEKQHEQEVIAEEAAKSKTIQVTEFVSANELAKLLGVPVTEIISTCMSLGLFVSINQRLDAETLTVVSEEFGYKVEFVSVDVQEAIQDKPDDLIIYSQELR